MGHWRGWFGSILLIAGCQALPALPQLDDANLVAGQLWEKGQDAMRQGRAQDAVALYQQSLAADPRMVVNHLSLSAAYLELKAEDDACRHLGVYVSARPDQWLLRCRYAELLARLQRLAEARAQFEQFIADAQDHPGPAAQRLIHCHSRLMEIAEDTNDEYQRHLHRGIGMYLLARERSELPDLDGQLPAEGLYCRAAAELGLARMLQPGEARPSWYLYLVWTDLGQRQPATCRLREAAEAAPFSDLTPAERRNLYVASQSLEAESRR